MEHEMGNRIRKSIYATLFTWKNEEFIIYMAEKYGGECQGIE